MQTILTSIFTAIPKSKTVWNQTQRQKDNPFFYEEIAKIVSKIDVEILVFTSTSESMTRFYAITKRGWPWANCITQNTFTTAFIKNCNAKRQQFPQWKILQRIASHHWTGRSKRKRQKHNPQKKKPASLLLLLRQLLKPWLLTTHFIVCPTNLFTEKIKRKEFLMLRLNFALPG